MTFIPHPGRPLRPSLGARAAKRRAWWAGASECEEPKKRKASGERAKDWEGASERARCAAISSSSFASSLASYGAPNLITGPGARLERTGQGAERHGSGPQARKTEIWRRPKKEKGAASKTPLRSPFPLSALRSLSLSLSLPHRFDLPAQVRERVGALRHGPAHGLVRADARQAPSRSSGRRRASRSNGGSGSSARSQRRDVGRRHCRLRRGRGGRSRAAVALGRRGARRLLEGRGHESAWFLSSLSLLGEKEACFLSVAKSSFLLAENYERQLSFFSVGFFCFFFALSPLDLDLISIFLFSEFSFSVFTLGGGLANCGASLCLSAVGIRLDSNGETSTSLFKFRGGEEKKKRFQK